MIGTFMAALDQTAVNTALPTAVGTLGAVERYPWVFAAYLLAGTVSAPIAGRLADTYGRKRTYAAALGVFVVGSALCGAAQTMDQLIAFRALQGIGGGGVIPVGLTMVADLFTVRERARIQGLFSSMWAVSSLVGPVVGGLLAQFASWRLVFVINVPLGVATLLLLATAFREIVHARHRDIDWAGAGLFCASSTALLLGLNGVASAVTVSLAVILGVVFVRVERSVPEPLIDLDVLRVRVVSVGLYLNTLIGVLMFGVLSYLPVFIQGVRGRPPVEAGAVVSTMSIGWPIASVLCGLLLVRVGPRRAVIFGVASVMVGAALLATLRPETPTGIEIAAASFVGFGIGFVATTVLVASQSAVGWERRGIVTGLIGFTRNLGGAVGVSVLGAVLATSLGANVHDISPLLDRTRVVAGADVASLRTALAGGLHLVYLALAGVTLAMVAVVWKLPWHLVAERAATDGAKTEVREIAG